MNELQEEIDAINFAQVDDLSVTIGAGWRTFVKILVPMLPMIAICAMPPALIITAIPFDEIAQRMNLSEMNALKMQLRVEQLITAPFGMIVMLTAMVTAVRAIAQSQLGMWANFSTAMRRMLPTIGTSLLFGAMVIACVFLLIVPVAICTALPKTMAGIVGVAFGVGFVVLVVAFAVKLTFLGHSIVVGGTAGIESMKESMRLVKGKWWLTLGILVVVGLCGVLLQIPAFVAGICEGRLISLTENHFHKCLTQLSKSELAGIPRSTL